MDMRPRPVQHLNIHTESVVTAVDGPTKLYLDKTSVKENVSYAASVQCSEIFRFSSLQTLFCSSGGQVF